VHQAKGAGGRLSLVRFDDDCPAASNGKALACNLDVTADLTGADRLENRLGISGGLFRPFGGCVCGDRSGRRERGNSDDLRNLSLGRERGLGLDLARG
jgi:hypothetical protein